MNGQKRALVLLNDLMFRVKIDDLLRRSGFIGEYVSSAETLLARAREQPPAAVLIDLNYTAGQPLEAVAQLKAAGNIPVLAYVSHVQVELRAQAKQIGCDEVVARSALAQSLPVFLEEVSTGMMQRKE